MTWSPRTRKRAAAVGVAAIALTAGLMTGLETGAPRTRPAGPGAQPAGPGVLSAPPAAPSPRPAIPAPRTGTAPPRRPPQVSRAWVERVAPQVGLSPAALRAYATAEVVLRREQPGCRISWNTVAGVGEIESGHGTYGGRAVLPDGTLSRPLLGPRLDGTRFAAITDSDAGALDGDATWDRAVGPLQFLPSSWARWGRDANGDGRADPQNLDDAALSAAAYLCASGADVTTPEGWSRTIFSYNHSHEYVQSVLAAADRYGSRSRRAR